MTTSLTIGPSITVVQSTAYALPPVVTLVHSTLALEISSDGTTWNALTGANTVGAPAGSSFVRCTAGAAVITCRRY